jgi:quercetin dioxygenase-like cupin family protein
MKYDSILDDNTKLAVFEHLPFQPKRVYYMQGMAMGDIRGKHAHKKNRQIIICARGSFTLQLSNLRKRMNINDWHLLEPGDWHVMCIFSSDCLILVLASEEYDPNDYIREEDSW